MPNNATGRIDDDIRIIEKRIPLKISHELKNKGKKSMTDPVTGYAPTDEQLLLAEVVATSLVPAQIDNLTPPVGDQFSKGSCVSYAVGYYMRSMEQRLRTGALSFNNAVNIFSPEYLFDYTQLNSCNGSTLLGNLDLLTNKGTCLYNSLPYSSACYGVDNASPHDVEAATFRITGYTMYLKNDRSLVKQLIASGRPLYLYLRVDSAFYNANSSFIWNASNHTTTLIGQHAVTVVGYDDSKNAYKIVNQWGTGWGAAGYSWIDYDFFETSDATGTYVVTLEGAMTGDVSPLPVAVTGPDASIPENTIGILDASASYSPTGYIKSYAWSQKSGPTVSITNPTAAVASVATWAGPGTYVFEVIVTDSADNTASDTITLIVTAVQIIIISVGKKKTGKNVADIISWQISMSKPPQRVELEQSWSATTNFNYLYTLPALSGTYTTNYIDPTKTRSFRYYRLKLLTAEGDIIYSEIKSIK